MSLCAVMNLLTKQKFLVHLSGSSILQNGTLLVVMSML